MNSESTLSVQPTTQVGFEGDTAYVDNPMPAELSLLPEPLSVALDPLAELEALLVAMRVEDRASARAEGLAEEALIEQLGAEQVAALHDKAGDILAEGWCSGLGQIAGGALGITGGALGLAAGTDSAAALEGGKQSAQIFQGAGGVAEGFGGLGAAYQRGDQTERDADITEAETAAAAAERRAGQANSNMSDAREALRSLLSQIQRIHEAELAAQNAAVFMA
jgi:hypothetical protein